MDAIFCCSFFNSFGTPSSFISRWMNGAAVNYGNLAANKKQLEGWLQYRGLDRGQIEQFLTYSVLSQ